MRCGYAVLIASLLLTMGGCRELGSYLSPEERADCESGARTEGCPDTLSPGAEVLFLDPHPLKAGEVYVEEGLGRYLELRFSVESRLDIERVDLACAGLQLASWRPRERGTELDLEATVDLLPCRMVSTSDGGVDVELHTVPIEVQVLGPVGGVVVLRNWSVVVNLDDTRIPDSRALIDVALEASVPDALLFGGRPVEFRAVSADPADPLAADIDPEVWVDGVRVTDADVSQEPVGTYFIRLPSGLRTRHTSGREFSELLAPKLARVTITATTQSGRNSVGRLEVGVEKDRSDRANQPELLTFDVNQARSLPVDRPVAVPANAQGVRPGTLMVSGFPGESRAYLFDDQDTWVALPSHGNEVFALTEVGTIVWQVEPSTTQGFLQTDLSGLSGGRDVTLPEPAIAQNAFRLGNGEVCVEELVAPPTAGCEVAPSAWRVECLKTDGLLRTVDLLGSNEPRRGAPLHTLALQDGWLSASYQTPDCAPPQVVGAWGSEKVTASFQDSQLDGDLNAGDTPVMLSAGPDRAVVGSTNSDFTLSLELIDVAGGGTSLGQYFTPPASSMLSVGDAILWADADGGLVLLRAPGVLERWLPGDPTPAQSFDLANWVDGDVEGAFPTFGFDNTWHSELTRVVHSNGDVSFSLWRNHPSGPPQLLTLEVNQNLEPVWAQVWYDVEEASPMTALMTVGLPDGPYLDVLVSDPNGQTQHFRWAR